MVRPRLPLNLDHLESPYQSESGDSALFSSNRSSPGSAVSESGLRDIHTYPLIKFTNTTLCENGEFVPDAELWVNTDSGKIVEPQEDQEHVIVDLEGLFLSSGFIDAQINGAFGFNFSDHQYGDGSPEAFQEALATVSRRLLCSGCTSFCPTLPSSYPHVYRKVLPNLRATRTSFGADSLGYHLEGPFLSPRKPGIHPQDALATAPKGLESFQDMYGQENLQHAKMITVAVEREGILETVPDLAKMGITVCLGHSVVDYKMACDAVGKGARMITHIYNAMTQPHHRDTGLFGLLGAPSSDLVKKPYFGIITDGLHVHPSAVSIAYHSNPEGCCVVTDAQFPLGLPSGTYTWGKQKIVKKDLELHLNDTNIIAGSAITIDAGMRHLMKWADIDLAQALKTATTNPAKAIRVYGQKGTLAPGADADLCVVDAKGHVRQVFKLGNRVYTARS